MINQNTQVENKSLVWIVFTIEAHIIKIALFIGFSQLFFTFIPGGILQDKNFQFFLTVAIVVLLSAWATKRGVKTVLKRTVIKREDVLKISYLVGLVPLVLAASLFLLGKIASLTAERIINPASYFIPVIVTAISYGFFTYFWLKQSDSNQFEKLDFSRPATINKSVGSQLKSGLVIGLILVAAVAAFAFSKYWLEQKAIEKLLNSPNREEIQKKILEQLSPADTNTQNKTAIWQTYKNNKYGFKVKYPPNFNLEEKVIFNVPYEITVNTNDLDSKEFVALPSINQNDQNKRVFLIDIQKSKEIIEQAYVEIAIILTPFSPRQIKESNYDLNIIPGYGMTDVKEAIIQNSLSAIEFSGKFGSGEYDMFHTMVKNPQDTILFDIALYQIGDLEISEETYREILSTFQFLE